MFRDILILKKILWVSFHAYFSVKLVLYVIQKYFSESQSGGYDIYASLPRSLKKEVLVRSKVEEDPDVLQARQAIVSSKSPSELRSSSSHVFTIPETTIFFTSLSLFCFTMR